jgi:hypothetical protein
MGGFVVPTRIDALSGPLGIPVPKDGGYAGISCTIERTGEARGCWEMTRKGSYAYGREALQWAETQHFTPLIRNGTPIDDVDYRMWVGFYLRAPASTQQHRGACDGPYDSFIPATPVFSPEPISRAARVVIGGVMVITCDIDTDGRPHLCRVTSSTEDAPRVAWTLAWANQFRFTPALCNGVAMAERDWRVSLTVSTFLTEGAP